jgi:hypothetical protein
MKVDHKFLDKEFNNPKWDVNTLILGTFNPQGGKEFADYYYGRVKESKKGKSFSNKFWPSLSTYLQSIDNSQAVLLPGDFKSKENLMRKYNFSCLDLIKSVELPDENEMDIRGNGYKDQHLFSAKTTRVYNTEDIISIIKNKKIKKVIASWGALSSAKNSKSVRKEVYREIQKIKDSSPNTIFKIDGIGNLPPFGRKKVSNLAFGKLIYEEFKLIELSEMK